MRLSTELRYPRLFCTHLNFHVIILIRVEAVALPANLLSRFHFPNCGKVIDTKSKKPCGNPSVFMTQLWIDQDPPVNNKEVGFRHPKKKEESRLHWAPFAFVVNLSLSHSLSHRRRSQRQVSLSHLLDCVHFQPTHLLGKVTYFSSE